MALSIIVSSLEKDMFRVLMFDVYKDKTSIDAVRQPRQNYSTKKRLLIRNCLESSLQNSRKHSVKYHGLGKKYDKFAQGFSPRSPCTCLSFS